MAGYYSGESQDSMIEWEPSSVELFSSTSMTFYDDDVTSLSLNMEEMLRTIKVDGMESLVSLSFPNLVSVLDEFSGELGIEDCESLVSLDLPKLALVETNLSINGCTSLETINLTALEEANGLLIESSIMTSLDLSALVTVGGSNIAISGNTALESIDLSSFVPTSGGEFYFAGNALTAASVNAILARFVANAAFVSGQIDLSGGTNAAPTGQGLTDVTTLRGRGVDVTVTE